MRMSEPSLRRRKWFGRLLTHAALLALAAIFLFPLLWMLSTSLKPVEQTMVMPPEWIPHPARWSNFLDTLRYIPLPRYTWNSTLVSLLAVLGTVLASSLAGYGFACVEWKGRDAFFAVTLATMMVPFPVLMVPLYGVFRELHWIGTLTPLWAPAFFGSAFNIFLFRQFFKSIPSELLDAARVDGCPEWRLWAAIVLPLAKPVIAVVALFQFITTWNDFLGPLLFVTKEEHFTLALGLQLYQSQNGGTQWHLLMAAAAIATAPILVLFALAQKTFVRGIVLSGLKE